MSGIIGAAELKRLLSYTDWANGAILDATAALTPEQLTRDLRSSFASVLDTLRHIAESDWIWLRRWNGVSPTEPPAWKIDRKSTRLNSSHVKISYAVFCLKKNKQR